jgi:hypothetical protein
MHRRVLTVSSPNFVLKHYMKAHLIDIINEKEIITTDYFRRLNLELIYFERHQDLLNRYWQLKKQGHLLYPEMSTGCSSLVLHLLGLNPMDPMPFNLPFLLDESNLESDLCFYCSELLFQNASGLSLQPLKLLSELQIVCQYLHIQLDDITQKVVHETHIHFFIDNLLNNFDLRSRSYYLQETTVDYFDQLENCRATTFEELVHFVYAIHIQIYPDAESKKHLIAEVYMDVLLVGWIWWLGRLKK